MCRWTGFCSDLAPNLAYLCVPHYCAAAEPGHWAAQGIPATRPPTAQGYYQVTTYSMTLHLPPDPPSRSKFVPPFPRAGSAVLPIRGGQLLRSTKECELALAANPTAWSASEPMADLRKNLISPVWRTPYAAQPAGRLRCPVCKAHGVRLAP
ncbi:hypothetical protein B0H11DRAFT_2213457 [Mycena galericulata]|nr:hypothetical protein B0H11DRAFT_2213457 [Mycena galericulata]